MISHEQDRLPNIAEQEAVVVSFEAYRSFLDADTNYRYAGIVSEQQYEEAIGDPTTIYARTEHGFVPSIVSLKYADGFDIGRTRKLVGGKEPMLATVDPSLVDIDQLAEVIESGKVVLVESDSSDTQSFQESIRVSSVEKGLGLSVNEFIDPRLDKEGQEFYKTAWLALYSAELDILEKQEQTTHDLISTFGKENYFPADGLSVVSGDMLKNNPRAMEQLWDLFKDRFEWLGDFHPISMEDTREVFEEIATSSETFTSAKFENGEIACAGIFMHDPSICSWLKPEMFKQALSEDQGDRLPMYFFGIASKKSGEALGRMAQVVKFHCDLAAKAGIKYDLTFESSNMSSTYIPASVEAYINASGTLQVNGGLERVKKTDYWFISAQ